MKIVESIEGSSKTAISYISKVERADLVISGEYISRNNIQNWSMNNLASKGVDSIFTYLNRGDYAIQVAAEVENLKSH
jgi:hypothetical protein